MAAIPEVTSPLASAPTTAGADLLTPIEASVLLCLSVPHLALLRCKRLGPRYLKLGHRTIRYHRSDLIDWLDHCTRSTADSDATLANRS